MSDLVNGDEVELIPGFDHLYNPDILNGRLKGAFVGCHGTVQDLREEEGFDHIFVEWKKDDWRYAGMPDGWTYASHFRKITPPITTPRTNSDLIVRELVKGLEERDAQEREVCPDCGEPHTDVDRHAKFLETLIRGEQKILDSDAFVIIAMRRDLDAQEDEVLVYQGEIEHAEITDAAREALERQIISLAAQLTLDRQ